MSITRSIKNTHLLAQFSLSILLALVQDYKMLFLKPSRIFAFLFPCVAQTDLTLFIVLHVPLKCATTSSFLPPSLFISFPCLLVKALCLFLCFLCLLETGSQATEVGLQLLIFLPPGLKC